MSRISPAPDSRVVASPADSAPPESPDGCRAQRTSRPPGLGWDSWIIRIILVVSAATTCYTLEPFHLRGLPAAGMGLLMAVAILLAELRLRRAALSGVLGGAFGAVVGLFAALLVTFVISRTAEPEPTKSFLEYTALFAFAYLGFVVGSEKGGGVHLEAIGDLVSGHGTPSVESAKLLDTSVLIDGRIAEICDAQFLDGPLLVPQFVLHELQMVADSSDSLKRQRGRRGLDVVERMRKIPGLTVRILPNDASQIGEVDHKLIEVARKLNAKIVTNDFNLNKLATVQGLTVLNVNQLANALKPAVLPGEAMRVFVLREGKEAAQGVAYLDDGTMVVVDGARRFINKNVDVIVTSVHQTTAGKMIFGRMDDRADSSVQSARAAVAGASATSAVAPRSDGAARLSDSNALGRSPRTIYPDTDAD
jgi:uncharacterized protein YacL